MRTYISKTFATTILFALFCFVNYLFSITGLQYYQEHVVSEVKETLQKGEQSELAPSETLSVQSKLLEIEKYAPNRADAIRKQIEESPKLRQQFADFSEKIDIKSEINQKTLTPQEIKHKLPVFAREVDQDINRNVHNKRELTEQLLSDKKIAVTFDAALCHKGNCEQPFSKKMDEIVLEKSQKMGVNINQLLTTPIYTISEKEIEENVGHDLELLYDVTIPGKTREAIEVLINHIQNIKAKISALSEKTIEERMNKNTGYDHFVQQIQHWWDTIEDNPDINPAEREQLHTEKEVTCKTLVDILMHDLSQEFKQFETELIATGEDFPYYQIIKIQEAVRSRKRQFLSSEEMYGNPEIKKDLDTKYALLYQLLEKSDIAEIFANKHINPLIVDDSGNPHPEYKKSVQMIRLRLFGKLERLKTFNQSSLAALLWSIANYISRITVKIENDQKKAMELVKLYFENNFNLLIEYRNMFQSIISPKSVETDIVDIINMIQPALDTETMLKFTTKQHTLTPELDTSSDW